MLFISHKEGFQPERMDGYRIGEDISHIDPHAVTEVQATEEELVYILDYSIGLPISHREDKKDQRWFGDHAKWIVANLF